MLSYVFLGCFLTIAICLSVSTAYYRYQILHVFVNIKTFKNVIFASKINCEKPNRRKLKRLEAQKKGKRKEEERESKRRHESSHRWERKGWRKRDEKGKQGKKLAGKFLKESQRGGRRVHTGERGKVGGVENYFNKLLEKKTNVKR